MNRENVQKKERERKKEEKRRNVHISYLHMSMSYDTCPLTRNFNFYSNDIRISRCTLNSSLRKKKEKGFTVNVILKNGSIVMFFSFGFYKSINDIRRFINPNPYNK